MTKSLEDIQLFLFSRLNVWRSGEYKYIIVSVCVMFWRHLISRSKDYFVRISMVGFVLKGGNRYQKHYLESYLLILRTIFPFLVWLWDNPNRKYDLKMSKQCDFCIVWLCNHSLLRRGAIGIGLHESYMNLTWSFDWGVERARGATGRRKKELALPVNVLIWRPNSVIDWDTL
jgi:hypothetical protein